MAIKCPKCEFENPENTLFCGKCGTRFPSLEEAIVTETLEKPIGERARESSDSRTSSWDTVMHGRFLPGTMLAGRYRIVGLLGKGGMGEVYRADDIKLGQAVALKFLPPQFSKDPIRLEYFYNEVRLTRQISHPNVCRVHDIGEVDGQHFLSMEYVDGEDLATLIRRIGRLPRDKGLDIAHQICAGMAAAHDRGVLHRDLKPSNVMLDGRGRVRITDFGLARLTTEPESSDAAIGTPAYMAPEQMAGGLVTEQSDIYSLGLILFEIFTAKKVYTADSAAELLKLRELSSPVAPSTIVPDIDPEVEQVILQCLKKEPQHRPQSVLAVSAALPGGDPLAAALAAGETPSPEMVAAAGKSGRLHPRVAIGWLAVLLLGLIVAAFLADNATVLGNAGFTEKPDALDKVARDIIDDLGYDETPKDRAYGFEYDKDYLWALRAEGNTSIQSEKNKHAEQSGMYFWYRQSPEFLIPLARYSWQVSSVDPASSLPGMIGVRLKGNGELIEFRAVPHKSNKPKDESKGVDWAQLFVAAGFDLEKFSEKKDDNFLGDLSVSADDHIVWEGTRSNGAKKVRVEAASYDKRPVYFRIADKDPLAKRIPLGIPPSDKQPIRVEEYRAIEWSYMLIILVAAALVARRSLRLGRSDRKGSFRLGVFILSLNLFSWFFEASHVPHFGGELAIVYSGLGSAMFYALYFGLVYLAFEPYIRRFWPKLLISWNRLLAGRFRDPSVGRDLLVGSAVGVWCWPVLEFLTVSAPDWLGPVPPFWRTIPSTLLGGRYLLGVSIFSLSAVGVSLVYLFTLLLLRLLLRKWWLWAPAFIILGSLFFILTDITSLGRWLMVFVLMTSLLLLNTRLGLLAAIAFFYASYILHDFPLTADLNAWYLGSSLFALGLIAAIGVYGFYTSTTGRPHVRDEMAPF
ncbi:MAG: protein kinase [Candidatus Aminicenantes bacterium]|jgi:serine/threonine-protein kinase